MYRCVDSSSISGVHESHMPSEAAACKQANKHQKRTLSSVNENRFALEKHRNDAPVGVCCACADLAANVGVLKIDRETRVEPCAERSLPGSSEREEEASRGSIESSEFGDSHHRDQRGVRAKSIIESLEHYDAGQRMLREWSAAQERRCLAPSRSKTRHWDWRRSAGRAFCSSQQQRHRHRRKEARVVYHRGATDSSRIVSDTECVGAVTTESVGGDR